MYHGIIKGVRSVIERIREKRNEEPEYEDYADEDEEEEAYMDPFSRWMDGLAKKKGNWKGKKFPDPRMLAEKLSISDRNRRLLEEEIPEAEDEPLEELPEPVSVIPADPEVEAEVAAESGIPVVPMDKERVTAAMKALGEI